MPLTQGLFNGLADVILSREVSTDQRTWIFIDDLGLLGQLDRLAPLLNLSRAKGVCFVLAAQDMGNSGRFGLDAAQQLASNCSHITVLGTRNLETANWAERHFGPPLRAADLMSLPPTGPEHGMTAYHLTPRAGTYLAHRSWDWVLANL